MGKRRPSGDGMVRKRDDGRWEGRIVVGHKANSDPIFRHVYAKTQKALLDKLHQNIECYRNVELTEDSRMTLGDWLDRWLTEYKAGTVRPSTLQSYCCYIEYYIKPQLGDKQISLISQQDIQRMYRRLKAEGRLHEHPEMDHQLSDSMVRHIHSTLHAALKDAVQAHVIPRNPTKGTTAPKPNCKPKRILTRAELDVFLAVVEQDEVWRDFFQTELMTGLRRGEICGLQWGDFDGDAGTLKVCRTLHNQRKGEYAVGETKNNQSMRTIILPYSVTEILRRRKADAISQWIFPEPVKPEDPIDPNAAYRHMKTLLQRAGLPSIRFHNLRHTFTTHTLTSGVDVKTLAGILGHTNASFTLDTYTHVTPDMREAAGDIVGGFMEDLFKALAKKRKAGDGLIRQRADGRWEERYVVDYDDHGYPKTKAVFGKSKRECAEKLAALKAQLGGIPSDKLRPEGWLDYWYETHCKPNIRTSTQSGYEDRIRLHIKPELGEIPLNRLTQNDLQQFYARLKKSGRKTRTEYYGEGLSNRMGRMCHATCRSALEKAVQDGLIRLNPAEPGHRLQVAAEKGTGDAGAGAG